MRNFLRIAHGVDTAPVLLELVRNADLWDEHRTRKTYAGTPHAEMSDIWVRFRPQREIEGLASHQEEYRCEFYDAWRRLPSLRPLVAAIKARVDAVELGSILITRLPPHAAILQHTDGGAWAPTFYNCKAHVTLSGSSRSNCAGEEVTMAQGDVWTFDNLLEHGVHNPGDTDRIALIISMRCEP